MSYTEPEADGVQPDQGQGDGGSNSGGQPYADYLNRVPEEVRGDIEPIFQDWNKSVNSRFEEHANYRKQWEPWEQSGLTQYDPRQVSDALGLLNDPQRLREWAGQNYPDQFQLQQQQQQPEQDLTFDQYVDPARQLDEKLNPVLQRLEQFEQRWQQMQQQQEIARIDAAIQAETAKLREEHAAHLPPKVAEQFDEIIERFGWKYAQAGSDPVQVVQSAWRDFQALSNQLATSALQEKADQPHVPSVSGGGADVAPEQPKTLREANALAMQQWRANSAA